MSNSSISIIGAGNLGMSIADGLIKTNFLDNRKLYITRRRIHLLKNIQNEKIVVTEDNLEAVKQSQVIIIAVKPHQLLELLKSIKPALSNDKILISAATGIETKRIIEITGKMTIFRVMPNTAIAIRESMTCISSVHATEDQEKFVVELFDQLGKTLVINEELMAAATVVGACGVAFALRFLRAMSQGGIEIGFGSELSQLITAQTIKGAAELILSSNNHPEREIDKVTTPQGVTISGLNEMEHQGFSSSVIKGLITSYKKIEKVSAGNKNNSNNK